MTKKVQILIKKITYTTKRVTECPLLYMDNCKCILEKYKRLFGFQFRQQNITYVVIVDY